LLGDAVKRPFRTGANVSWYYRKRRSSEFAQKAFYKHVLWLIENHPDAEVTGMREARLDHIRDREVYYEAKKLWITQTETYRTNMAVLTNAADFFLIHDEEIAEELLKKAKALEPQNPEWPRQLGHLYSLGLSRKSSESRIQAAKQALRKFERLLSLTTSEQKKFYLFEELG